ncbi:MAG: hypothetical protein COB04_02905 [Gammaproteobacteria bacterium]|nr:MAG: hypothetical protein COB04_02905 [Gammaproteobacteria bacterium]
MINRKAPSSAKQQGIVLVTGLVFLLVLTLLGVMGASNSALNLQIAGSLQDKNNTFHVGEAALQAILWLENNTDIDDQSKPLKRIAADSDPYRGLAGNSDPLSHVADNTDVQTIVSFMETRDCQRTEKVTDDLKCDYYTATSDTVMVSGARSVQNMGIQKEVIGSASW